MFKTTLSIFIVIGLMLIFLAIDRLVDTRWSLFTLASAISAGVIIYPLWFLEHD